MSDAVTFQAGESVSEIRLDDGGANVMSVGTLQALNDALDSAEAADQPVVLAGREGMFSGGFDLDTFEAGGDAPFEMLRAGAETAERLQSLPVPVVVACTGHAVAMGLFLVLSGDLTVGAAGEFTLQANEAEIGLTVPHFATVLGRQRLAPSHVTRVLALAEPYDPEAAEAAGILDHVVPAAAVVDRAREEAESLARLDLPAHAASKARAREPTLERLRAAIEADVAAWQEDFQ